jgi:glycosyltransferase involved in cell wall biosynthesis
MKIAFLHYHLKTGGVTTVLKRQVSALQDRCEVLVLTGDRAGTTLPCRVVEIPGLGYDHPDIPSPTPKTIADRVLKALSDMWPGGCDVLHIHNPTLAKNQHFIRCIKRLQASGVNLFLQIHDFAEDGRPGVYSRESYPTDCHYGVINTRDRRILVKAGLAASGVHLIPNAIYPLPVVTGNFPEGLVLYPVRAIRRKNIGEAILLSLYLRPDQYLGITQPPNSQRDMASYQDWRAYVKQKRLNVHFEIGRQHDFSALVGAASSMVTTSITEGFGFSFLEPWTAGKMLRGRRLGNICTDFEGNGLRLDFLYDRLDVPLEWFDADPFFQLWQRTVKHAAETYHYRVDPEGIHQHMVHLARQDVVDFGLLNERYQRQVLSHLLSTPGAKAYMASLNPLLSSPAPGDDVSEILENNRRSVAAHYGVETYREQLLSIYERVVHQPVHQHIDKQVLLDAFFDLDRFSLLKWGAYEG